MRKLTLEEAFREANQGLIGNDIRPDADPVTSALLQHCFSHFQGVVAKLKGLVQIVADEYPETDERRQLAVEANDLLIEALIVEVPK